MKNLLLALAIGLLASSAAAQTPARVGPLSIQNALSEIGANGTAAQAAARGNLGLGSAATLPSSAFDAAGLAASEATRATAAEAVNAASIVSETTRALTAEGTNVSAVASEIVRATGAEGVNATAISNEAATARAAEGMNATATAAALAKANLALPTAAAGPLATQVGANSAAAIAAGLGYTPYSASNPSGYLTSASGAVTVPPSYQASAPDLIADYVHQLFMARVEGQPTLSSFSGTTFVGGATGSSTFIDPASAGHFSTAGSPRLTTDTISRKPVGVLVEPGIINYIPDPVALATGWSRGASNQGTITTAIPQLFPGVAVVASVRDTGTNANTGFFTFTMPSNTAGTTTLAFQWNFGIWVFVPSGSAAISTKFQSSGTGISNTSVPVDLNKKGVWQYTSGVITNTGSAFNQAIIIQTVITGDAGSTIYTTAPVFTPIPSPASFTSSARVADTLVSAGAGLDNLGGTSGTLVYRGFAIGSYNTAVASGGIQASDSAAANSVTLQVVGDPINPYLQAIVKAGGTVVATRNGSAIQAGQPYTAAVSWSPTTVNYADSLGVSATATVSNAPSGMSSFTALPGPNPLERIGYIASALSLPALQSYVAGGAIVNLVANPAAPGLTIPTCFNGLSWETNDSLFNGQFNASASSLIALYNRLGCVNTRIGGSSSDLTFYPTSAQINNLAAFLALVNGGSQPLVFGLNLGAGTGTTNVNNDVTIAGNVMAAIPNALLQIGNEPDQYIINANRTVPYAVTAYESDWSTLYAAIIAAVPTAHFAGPDIAATDQWYLHFLGSSAAAHISLASRHFYPIGPGSTATAQNLFASDYLPAEFAAGDTAAAAALSLPVRMTEMNSVFSGGQTGISNAQAAPVWALEVMGQLATAGFAGVDFHGGRTNIYSAMTLSGSAWTPQPLYYALLAFSALEGGRIIPVSSDTSSNVVYSFGVKGGDGKTRILIVNKSLTQTATVNVGQSSGTWTQASALIMTATSATATNTTLGGSTVSSTGAYSPMPVVTSTSGSSAPVTVPPASAAVVTLS